MGRILTALAWASTWARSTLGLATFAATLAISMAAEARAAPPSPLGSEPATIEYVSDNAPFVVFDVSPRSLNGANAARFYKEVTLNYVATDALHQVAVFTYAVSPRGGLKEVGTRVSCGSQIAGHHSCVVPVRDAVLLLGGGEGQFGLRIEAEGVEGERSTVRITLPVQAGGARPSAPMKSPLSLTLLSAPAR